MSYAKKGLDNIVIVYDFLTIYLGGHTMDLSNLRENHEKLLSYMRENGYSKTYIQKFRTEINWIFENEAKCTWTSYSDIYYEYKNNAPSKDNLRNKGTIIGAIEQFDLYDQLPDGRRRHILYERGSYPHLELEFKELIDFFNKYELERGKKPSTIKGESLNTASFLYEMQLQGCNSLERITEDAVLSFFVSETGELIKSCSYKKNISAVFKAGLAWREDECSKILSYLPILRENRKNIQYLTSEEVQRVREVVNNGELSHRNKAIILLLLNTGLRGCDIAALTLKSIDWKNDKILLFQQKTDAPLELPLMAVVGNAIFDYLSIERPGIDSHYLFLSETKPYFALASGSVGSIVTKVLKIAGVRQNHNDRKGTHIFRHNLASTMLQNGVPTPIITHTLGHTAPGSLEPYLRADFVHLKECAISIEEFPLPREVLGI